MSPSTESLSGALPASRPATVAAALPWPVWMSVLAITSSLIGVHWDISWHRTIGRDAFWSPPHVAIYLGAVLSAISCGYLVFWTTFGGAPEARAASVRIWGLRAPLGAFLSAWGGVTMLVSAPFDDWWHGAYGLDVEILSPPHVVLFLGIFAAQMGTLLLVRGQLSRADEQARPLLRRLLLYTFGINLLSLMVLALEFTGPYMMHAAVFYRTVALCVLWVLLAAARATDYRWAATAVAGVYSAVILALLWILPLFPAVPRLGPVYQNVTAFIPPGFPVLVLPPAIAMDLLLARMAGTKDRWIALAAGTVFFTVLLALQWPFAEFLMSPASRNALFGSHYLEFFLPPTSYVARYAFYPFERTPSAFWTGMAVALVASVLSARMGLALGGWIRKVER